MKSRKIISILILAAGMAFSTSGFGQCDTIASICKAHITTDYISDGQIYRALLLDDQVAEFHTTFFGNTTYRVAGCSGLSDGNLIFSVFDNERNLLFTNSEYNNAPHWDFEVNSTLDCIIEAQLDPSALSSGCAVLLIGFTQ